MTEISLPRLPAVPSSWGDRRRVRIGLLGGSFNPAHDGHVHISREALRRLDLDFVWWLVSPGNPLKPSHDMAPLAARYQTARYVARHDRRIVPLCLESDWGTVKTADTLAVLLRRFPSARFVWIMGADNLIQLPRWERWESIMNALPIAVLDRAPYSSRALFGRAALRFDHARLRMSAARSLADRQAPAWIYLPIRRHDASATRLRAGRGAGWAEDQSFLPPLAPRSLPVLRRDIENGDGLYHFAC